MTTTRETLQFLLLNSHPCDAIPPHAIPPTAHDNPPLQSQLTSLSQHQLIRSDELSLRIGCAQLPSTSYSTVSRSASFHSNTATFFSDGNPGRCSKNPSHAHIATGPTPSGLSGTTTLE
ncbi:unnamed protein product [Vicia faba]|uniref:Uncharacterized protein n=1 Tax=Vicia faba TaxID=3906 RepID=A0AAV0YVS0_VICFA|nr:unnamed protein product [Vicia faba]